MFSDELKRVFKLIKKTGDKVIIYDSQEPEQSFTLMETSSYENIVHKIYKEEEKLKTELKPEDDNNKEVEKRLNIKDSESVNVSDTKIDKKDNALAVENTKKVLTGDGLTEEDLTDKINREISLWKSKEDESFFVEDNKDERFVKPWSIPSEVKQKAKEVE